MHKSKGKLSGVLHKGFKPDKCKTSLRMAVARIKLLRNRKEAQVRQMRREVAQLLEANQDMTARIRVEHVIREEKCMQAYDLIEVYCELIVARLSIIDSQKVCPIDLKEAIASVIFSSMRCSDVTELADVRKQFTSKYGKEFAAAALEVRPDSGVNRLVIEKLSAGAPDIQTKIKTLSSIAEEHNIKWEPKGFEEKLQKPNEDLLYGSATYSGGSISAMGPSSSSMSTPQPTYSGVSAAAVNSATSHVPAGPYSPAHHVSANSTAYENADSNASVPPSSQHGPSTYSSSQIPGSNNISHGNLGGPPYTQYGTTVPDTVSRNEEINQHRERKPSVGGANWNVEFKDATSAAQAAAESAEMASIAARAAAQLARQGNYSGNKGTGPHDSSSYNHENTPRKQPAEHKLKAEKRSFHNQSSGVNDPTVMPSHTRTNSGIAETFRVDSQNISTVHAPGQQFHSYGPESHEFVYEMPTESPHAHSPEHPHFDDFYERDSDIGRSEVHPFDFPGEKVQDTGPGGRSFKDVEIRKPSYEENTNGYYGNFNSSHDTFDHGNTTALDKQNDKTQDSSSSIVFDQYDSDVEEENVLDPFSSKYTEQLPGVQAHMEFSTVDWNQQHKSESPTNNRSSALFSSSKTEPSDNLGINRSDIPPPHSYNDLAPAFDSDGGSSNEEMANDNRISGNLVSDVEESIEDYESISRNKYGASPGPNVSYKEQHSGGLGGSPRFDYSGAQAQKNLNLVQSRDSDISDDETEPDKFKGMSSAGANENQSSPFSIQTAATFDDNEGDAGLNFGKLTPGLRNKPRQPPPYTKSSRESMLPRQSFPKVSASTEESIDSKENTAFKQTRSGSKSSLSAMNSSGENYSSEFYDRNQSDGTRGEARSPAARNFFDSDDTEKLSKQSGTTNSPKTKSSERLNSTQVLFHEKPGIGARPEIRSKMARNYFDSDDSEEELEQQQTPLSKRSGVQIQSRRTREVTSDSKRDGRIQTGAQYGDETEKVPSKTQVHRAFNNSSTEQRTERRWDAPVYPRVAVQRSSPKAEQMESLMAREKSQEAEMSRNSVPENKGNTETSAGAQKESTPKTPPAHVHPKLPTDYDSFAAHFRSLRTNPR
ncbi:hypothetical protein U9M48_017954 [Paspalum notatum var. saurae]|uniref:IST1-like protein n=1 Tax=Paspalum notatum var. saurae TaxID=547442 RepID=A0AAQ3WPF9_PASNO